MLHAGGHGGVFQPGAGTEVEPAGEDGSGDVHEAVVRRSLVQLIFATMFDDPSEQPADRAFNPGDRARDKADEFRMHAELAAVFEGHRKFEAALNTSLDSSIAR